MSVLKELAEEAKGTVMTDGDRVINAHTDLLLTTTAPIVESGHTENILLALLELIADDHLGEAPDMVAAHRRNLFMVGVLDKAVGLAFEDMEAECSVKYQHFTWTNNGQRPICGMDQTPKTLTKFVPCLDYQAEVSACGRCAKGNCEMSPYYNKGQVCTGFEQMTDFLITEKEIGYDNPLA